jgi:GNAT superfamily N-acetyltransferase
MLIKAVDSKRLRRHFLDVVDRIYAEDHHWIRPLDQDIEAVFDPQKNVAHQHGRIKRWVLYDDEGKPAGRIAAFIDYDRRGAPDKRVGGCGFFECLNDYDLAIKLFDTAAEWLQSNGMQAMEGPVNFGENHIWWGLLSEGFTVPYYGMNYNPAYYETLFRKYGFDVDYVQISNRIDVASPLPERFEKIARWVNKRPGHTFKNLNISMLGAFASNFVEIYNDAWKHFEHFKPMEIGTVLQQFDSMRPVMDEHLIWFAYVHGQPAAFLVVLPDANEMIRGLHGKLDLLNKLRFLWNTKTRKHRRMRAVIMGTKEKFRHLGIESALFIQLRDAVLRRGHYRELELSWVGDFNDQMLSIHKATGAVPAKRHQTMICRFNIHDSIQPISGRFC